MIRAIRLLSDVSYSVSTRLARLANVLESALYPFAIRTEKMSDDE